MDNVGIPTLSSLPMRFTFQFLARFFLVNCILFSEVLSAQTFDSFQQLSRFETLINTSAMVDQCDFTSECKAIYGDRATDCRNSQSSQSVCFCGASPCSDNTTPAPGGNFPGRFNPSRDLFLAFFDNRPDADDIHSQAGVATMLADNRFAGIDFYSVLGAYGRQGGAFLNSSTVMNRCLGNNNWTNAHPKDGDNWNASLGRVTTRVLVALNRGGDVWIMEAGQSDFSADLVRAVKQVNGSFDTQNRIHIVQHSDYNERQTTPADLAYVRNNTDYNRIPDGNAANNGSPQFNTRDGSQFVIALALPNGLGACWAEARRVADENNFSGNGHFENPAIEAGGFDFSDVVEATWIFGFNSLRNVNSFFATFPQTSVSETPPREPMGSTVPTAITPLLLGED